MKIFLLLLLQIFFISCSFISDSLQSDYSIPILSPLNIQDSNTIRIRLDYNHEKKLFSSKPSNEKFMCAFDTHSKSFSSCELDLHGNGTIYSKRKNFDVKILKNDSLEFNEIYTKRIRLLSLSSDKGYINNLLGYTLSKNIDLFHSEFKLIELYINETFHGMYLLIEDVEEGIKRNFTDIEFLIRRRNNDDIDLKYYKSKNSKKALSASNYIDSYKSIYYLSENLNEQSLLNELTRISNFKNYCYWLSLNMLLQNGDYTDELYVSGFSIENSNGNIIPYFDFSVWDFDDLFSPPHDGNVSNCELIYCAENSLDRDIMNNKVLYDFYKISFQELLANTLTKEFINNTFDSIITQLEPFLSKSKILDINNNLSLDKNSNWNDYKEYYNEIRIKVLNRRINILNLL